MKSHKVKVKLPDGTLVERTIRTIKKRGNTLYNVIQYQYGYYKLKGYFPFGVYKNLHHYDLGEQVGTV